MKKEELRQFYDTLYLENPVTGSMQTSDELLDELSTYIRHGIVLVLGAGQGRNALYLAQNNYHVSAVDISSVGLSQIEEEARRNGTYIHTECIDIRDLYRVKRYAAIVGSCVLHHLSPCDGWHVLEFMKHATAPGGVNLIRAFTDEGELADSVDTSKKFYPAQHDLEMFYDDWCIRQRYSLSVETWKAHEDGSHMSNTLIDILCQRPYG